MIINVGDNEGGIIVQSTEPVGDDTMLWIDTANNNTAKFWDGSAWVSSGSTIVQSDTPTGDSTKIWIDTGHSNIAKFWNGSSWANIPSVWA